MRDIKIAILTTVLVIILLPVAYMGLYFALLEEVHCCLEQSPYSAYATYRIANDGLEYVFRPATVVDRQLRPDEWSSPWE